MSRLVVRVILPSLLFIGVVNAQYPANYDLRTLNRVTSVKDQTQTCGSCWAFATCASIESSLLTLGLGSFDLSEDQLIDCHGFDEAPCYGGSYYMAQAFLSRHGGIVTESTDPYTPGTQNCVNSLPLPPMPAIYLEEMRFVPANQDSMKKALINHGAVATTMFFNPTNYNASSFKYYDPVISSTDSLYPHCVTIVGWSDTITFAGASFPGGWIIKDSYGTGWANSGYFYCAYADAGILGESVIFPSAVPLPSGQQSIVYHLDELGWVDNFGSGSTMGYAMASYTLTPTGGWVKPQVIKRVGSYAVDDNMTLTFDLYHQKSGNSLSDQIASVSVFCPVKGFYTVPVSTSQDTLFTQVHVKVTYQSHGGQQYPVPIEVYEAGHTSGIILSQNQGWVSADGNSWVVTGQGSGYAFDPCIKMYTETQDPLEVHQNRKHQYSIYPNPVIDRVYLQGWSPAKNGISVMRIADMQGRMIRVFDEVEKDEYLDVSGLESGSYVLIIANESGTHSIPFIKN